MNAAPPLTRTCPEAHCGRTLTEPATIDQRFNDLIDALNRLIDSPTDFARVHSLLTSARLVARRFGEPIDTRRTA